MLYGNDPFVLQLEKLLDQSRQYKENLIKRIRILINKADFYIQGLKIRTIPIGEITDKNSVYNSLLRICTDSSPENLNQYKKELLMIF